MKLSELIAAISQASVYSSAAASVKSSNPEITGVHYRSDRVAPGAVFVALPGQNADGHDFAADAVARGAAAVVVQRPMDLDACVVVVENTRLALAQAAAAFYRYPANKLSLIGITGTNGKTTTACLLEHILQCRGFCTGVIGTLNYHYAGKTVKSGLTTPEASDLQHLLAGMVDAGVTHVIMEVSSHGVVLDRIAQCSFAIGVFTNLSQDHLDFHKDMAHYWAAKKRFFTEFLQGENAAAVINMDDHRGKELHDALAGIRRVRVGLGNAARIWPSGLAFDAGGISGLLHLEDKTVAFHSPLVGRFNLENILCAAGAAAALEIAPETIAEGIETFTFVPGRLERVANTLDRHVFVDFSHTPAALENVLAALRRLGAGRLICIFGCGGDRDREKRPLMGEIAGKYADLAVVTSDNPRTEAPERIIEDIVAGMHDFTRVAPESLGPDFAPGTFAVEPDRRHAIRVGIRVSRPGDAILIAGKGHETYQIIGNTTVAFDDRVEAEQVLSWGMNDVVDTVDD
ncbi:MAG: UDP-N-acetylmuramoyl-L-alanyl-D-glutamate--2,6-diaminopimelate ligase [Desulfobacteraceae bacterium]|nr:UDP-N-acetylmuramoyl-L-alanyl-D-glutamate--2,6-diaminopimelate ligase [Desulfobacteraceae bacterium]